MLAAVADLRRPAGLITTNTTLARDGVAAAELAPAAEVGGLSGAPLTQRAREVVGYLVRNTDLPVIAAGGIMTVDDASAMFDLGAPLVQLYTGFIYSGPALPADQRPDQEEPMSTYSDRLAAPCASAARCAWASTRTPGCCATGG